MMSDTEKIFEIAKEDAKVAKEHFENSRYEEALKRYKTALSAFKKIGRIFDAAILHGNIASSYDELARYGKAEHHIKKALEMYHLKDFNQANHYWISAKTYEHQSKYRLALERLEQGHSIVESILPVNYYQLSRYDKKSAEIYCMLNSYEKAITLYEQILKRQENYFPEKTVFRNNLLNSFSLCLQDAEKYEYALSCMKEVVEYTTETYGWEHLETAYALMNLGDLLRETGDYEKALSQLQKAETILLSHTDRNKHKLSHLHNNMGLTYASLGRNKKALGLYRKTILEYGNVLDTNHQDIAILYLNMADIYRTDQRYKKAHKAYRQYLDRMHRFISDIFIILDNIEKEKVLQQHRQALIRYMHNGMDYLSYLKERNISSKIVSLQNELFGDWKRREGVFMHQSLLFNEIANSPQYEFLHETVEELNLKQYELARVLQANSKNSSQAIDKLRKKIGSLKNRVAKETDLLRRIEEEEKCDIRSISRGLKEGDLYLGFVSLDINGYMLFLINRDGIIDLLNINAEDGKAINKDIVNLGRNIQEYFGSDKDIPDLLLEANSILNGLYGIIINRYLLPYLPKTQRLVVASDGMINLLPFAALYSGEKYFIEEYPIVYAAASLRNSDKTEDILQNITVFSDPDYDSTSMSIHHLSNDKVHFLKQTLYETCKPLEGTKEEITSISSIYGNKATFFTGADANESNLRMQESPDVLHIATHAFIVNDSKNDPFLNTALALTGYNTSVLNGEEKGIFTGLKACTLNLSDTRLVVLSACETAAGRQSNVIGVSSLSKAFMLAGAKATIVSFWKADDETTLELFSKFYQLILQSESSNDSYSFHSAQCRLLEYCRRDEEINHPLFWASFGYFGL